MKYILGILIFVALILAGFFISQKDQPTSSSEPASGTEEVTTSVAPTGVTHSVVLTEDGYEPSEMTIALGDQITFSASAAYGRPHWPASNLHPTHSIYSAFDPKEPVPQEETWSFVFDQVGEWKFHDHLAPYHTGTVTVEE